jgi:hypothetical protein
MLFSTYCIQDRDKNEDKDADETGAEAGDDDKEPTSESYDQRRPFLRSVLALKVLRFGPLSEALSNLADNNQNGVQDATDTLISNTKIVLLYADRRMKRSADDDVLGTTTTDDKAEFEIVFANPQAGINLEITKDDERNTLLLEFKTDSTGSADIDVPVSRPADPFVAGLAVLTPSFAAQVRGTGKAGFRVNLYSTGIFVGETTILSDGTFTVTSSEPLLAGSPRISATMVDDKGAETVPVDCGTLIVVGPAQTVATPVPSSDAATASPSISLLPGLTTVRATHLAGKRDGITFACVLDTCCAHFHIHGLTNELNAVGNHIHGRNVNKLDNKLDYDTFLDESDNTVDAGECFRCRVFLTHLLSALNLFTPHRRRSCGGSRH